MHNQSSHQDEEINEDTFDEDLSKKNDKKIRRTNVDPVLHRALSTVAANQTLVHNQRNVLAKNYRRTSFNDEIVTINHNDADASFLLPNLNEIPENIRIRVMDNLVDTPTMNALEETKRLNWWVDKKLPCPKLYPLVTSGDGNCLLHATSLAMWGFHDHSLSMRKALNETLITSKPNNSLYRRWRWTQSVQNKKYGLVFSEDEWNDEWDSLLRLSSIEPRISQKDLNPSIDENLKLSSQSVRQYYESLEEFHVYVLANNIRRPIVVYSDTLLRTNNGEAISPIEFGGIYLPLEIPPDKCHKQPIFLAFDAAHFSALVPMEEINKSKVTYRIPLIDINTLDLLPIHFYIDPGLNFQWPIDEELSDEIIHVHTNYGQKRMNILEKYLNLSKEYSPLNNLTFHDDQTSTQDHLNNSDFSNDSNSTINNKKLSRSSFNSLSKIIRRTFIEPFSSTKRTSLKHNQHLNPDATIINGNISSSPLLNQDTNILTIILTNFQPKRPKTSDNMIKNYIDTCMKEYQREQNPKQTNDENENLQNISEKTKTNTSNEESIDAEIRRRLLNRHFHKNSNPDDLSPIENGQFPMNVNYVQRKSNQSTQSNRFEMTKDQDHYPESHVNNISNKSSPSQKLISSSLKRQQSLTSEKNPANHHLINSKLPITNFNKRTEINSSSNIERQDRF